MQRKYKWIISKGICSKKSDFEEIILGGGNNGISLGIIKSVSMIFNGLYLKGLTIIRLLWEREDSIKYVWEYQRLRFIV